MDSFCEWNSSPHTKYLCVALFILEEETLFLSQDEYHLKAKSVYMGSLDSSWDYNNSMLYEYHAWIVFAAMYQKRKQIRRRDFLETASLLAVSFNYAFA